MREDYNMDATKMWDYRVVRKESEDGSDEWYSVQEVYYDGDGQPMAQTVDLMIEGDTITGMRTQLELMLKSLEEPVLDESDITDFPPIETKTVEMLHREYCYLEIENTKLIDRLTELGGQIDEITRQVKEQTEKGL